MLNKGDVVNAFAAYQQERIPRTAKVQRSARFFGNILHIRDEISLLLRNTLLKQRKPDDYSVEDWLYGQYVPTEGGQKG